MRKFKKLIPVTLAAVMTCTAMPAVAYADNANVVTLGADLTEDQRASMYEYFGTSSDKVATIEVNNSQERQYLEGVAPEEQIGSRTYSCAYVEPTSSGGIQVKTANLTYVTSSMIASTLTTSGVENCNVVAAAPFAVSGTGALTGIMLAYEKASGKTLDESQKEAATQELVTTTDLSDSVGEDAATDIMNQVKEDVIEKGLSDPSEIQDTVNNAADKAGVTLTDDQIAQITDLMEKISQYDYDVKSLQTTLDNLTGGKDKGFFANLWDSIKGVFGGESDGGIINDTNDDTFGAGTIIDSTLDSVSSNSDNSSDNEGFFAKISNFFKNLFGGSKSSSDDADSSVKTNSNGTQDTLTPSKNNEPNVESTENADSYNSEDSTEDSSTGYESDTSTSSDSSETDSSSDDTSSNNGNVIESEATSQSAE